MLQKFPSDICVGDEVFVPDFPHSMTVADIRLEGARRWFIIDNVHNGKIEVLLKSDRQFSVMCWCEEDYCI
jgi:hypothetical protein